MLTLGGKAANSPGTVAGALLALVAATTGLVTAFGVNLTSKEQVAITAFAAAAIVVAPLVGSLFDHSKQQVAAQAATTTAIATGTTPPDPVAQLDQQIKNLQAQRDAVAAAGP